jgi:hypothetical protein
MVIHRMEWLTLHERVIASILPKPQKPIPAVPPRFSMLKHRSFDAAFYHVGLAFHRAGAHDGL